MPDYMTRRRTRLFLESAMQFCLVVRYGEDESACLATATKPKVGNKQLVVHRGTIGQRLRPVLSDYYYDTKSGMHEVQLREDDEIFAVNYPRNPNVGTEPVLVDQAEDIFPFLRVHRDDYKVGYLDDLTAMVTLNRVALPPWVFASLEHRVETLLNTALELGDENHQRLIASLGGMTKLIQEIELSAEPVKSVDGTSFNGTVVPHGLIGSLIHHDRLFTSSQGRGLSRSIDLMYYKGYYDLLRCLLTYDGIKYPPLPF